MSRNPNRKNGMVHILKRIKYSLCVLLFVGVSLSVHAQYSCFGVNRTNVNVTLNGAIETNANGDIILCGGVGSSTQTITVQGSNRGISNNDIYYTIQRNETTLPGKDKTKPGTYTFVSSDGWQSGDKFSVKIWGYCTQLNGDRYWTDSGAGFDVNVLINTPPSFTQQPSNIIVCAGRSSSFSVTATSAESYQWQINNGSTWANITQGATINGVQYSGVTTQTLSVTTTAGNLDANNTAVRCVIKDNCFKTATSNNALLQLATPGTNITVSSGWPSYIAYCAGSSQTVSLAASGGNLTYTWQVANAADGSYITIPGSSNGAAHTYATMNNGLDNGFTRVLITNGCTSITTSPIRLYQDTGNPAITTQPSSLALCDATSATFSVSGNQFGTVKWECSTDNGVSYSEVKATTDVRADATAANYVISPVFTSMSGNRYRAYVSNTCGNVYSNIAQLTASSGTLSFSVQPQNSSSCIRGQTGGSTSFSVTVSNGGSNLSYQWQQRPNASSSWSNVVNDGTTYTGATTPTLTVSPPNTTMNDSRYRCSVTSGCSSISDEAILTVNSLPPTISTPPANQSICSTAVSATFSVVGDNPSGLSYAWTVGSNSSVVSRVNSLSLARGTDYSNTPTTISVQVAVSNGCVTNRSATLTVVTTPVITMQPVGGPLCAGNDLSLSVTATGSSLSYQWQKDANNIGSNSASYQKSSITTSDAGDYTVKASNLCGDAFSNTARITVNTSVSITAQPTIDTSSANYQCENGSATISLTANGASAYQWQVSTNGGANWSNVTSNYGGGAANATSASLRLSNLQTTQHGNLLRCVVSGSTCGSSTVTSNTVTLNVYGTPSITISNTKSICQNSSFDISFTTTEQVDYRILYGTTYVAGTSTTALQSNSSGTTTRNIKVNSTSTDAGQYTIRVSKNNCTSRDYFQNLSVNSTAPALTAPASPTACEFASLTLTSTASGGGPYTFQWKKGGSNVGGESISTDGAASYTINSVSTTDAGTYTLQATNGCGSTTTSSGGAVTVQASATCNVVPITSQPQSVYACEGGAATFSLTVGDATLVNQFKWQYSSDGGSNWTDCGASISTGRTPLALTVTQSPGTSPTTQLRVDGLISDYAGLLFRVQIVRQGILTTSNSQGAKLNINNVAIDWQKAPPTQLSICNGNTLSISAIVKNGDPYIYTWTKNGTTTVRTITNTNIASDTYTEANFTQSATYTLEARNGCGTVRATIDVRLSLTAPTLTDINQPSDIAVCNSGTNVGTFTVSGTFPPDYLFQWQQNIAGTWTDVNDTSNGSNTRSYSIRSPLSINSNGSLYRCYVSNGCGFVASTPRFLRVSSATPTITAQPADFQACLGGDATFSVTSPNAIRYQWQYKTSATATPIPIDESLLQYSGGKSESLSMTNISTAQNGYLYACVLTNGCSSATGTPTTWATLGVNTSPPDITTQPADAVICTGSQVSFSVVSPNASSYEWFQKTKTGTSYQSMGVDVLNFRTGIKTATLNLFNAQNGLSENTYQCVLKNNCGTSYSQAATLIVNQGNVQIVTPPTGLSLCQNGTLNLVTEASGDGPYVYTWYIFGRTTPVRTSARTTQVKDTYTKQNVQPTDAGGYYVVVQNACSTTASSISRLAAVSVNIPVNVSDAASDNTVCVGGVVSLQVNATGDGLTYQWYKNKNQSDERLLLGYNDSGYNKSGITLADAGRYSVLVRGTCGDPKTADMGRVIVSTAGVRPPTPAANQTLCPGNTFTATIQGVGDNLTYQWRKDGIDIAGQTTTTFSKANIQASDVGVYTLKIVNGLCNLTYVSDAIQLNIGAGITTQPVAQQTLCPGGTLNLAVVGSGNALTYQWYKDGVAISEATQARYSKSSLTDVDAGRYYVIVTSDCGSAQSNDAIVIVSDQIKIDQSPSNATVCAGQTTYMRVTATAGAQCQWQVKNGLTYTNLSNGIAFDGTVYSGVLTPVLTLSSVSANADGFTYRCVVSNDCGTSQNSSEATLSVTTGGLSIQIPPFGSTVCPGQPINLTVSASGTGTLRYQWYKDGQKVGNNQNSYNTTASTRDTGQYWVEVSNGCSTVSSSNTKANVYVGVGILTQPIAQTVCPNTRVEFSVGATGQNLTYQWYKDGSNISGATNAVYVIQSAQASDEGLYKVIITGQCGTAVSVISNEVKLDIGLSLVLNATTTANERACAGDVLTFGVDANGAGLVYQWEYRTDAGAWISASNGLSNGDTWSGAQTSTFTITNAGSGSASVTFLTNRTWRCKVTSSCAITKYSNEIITNIDQSGGGAPVIQFQPDAIQTLCEGSDYITKVVMQDARAYSYNWLKDGKPLGITSDVISISNITASNAGIYKVEISVCGGAKITSNEAVLSIARLGLARALPSSLNVCADATLALFVQATGYEPFQYKWTKNEITPLNSTLNSYSKSNVTLTDAGQYKVSITSSNCPNSLIESVSAVTVGTDIVAQPIASKSVCPNATLVLTVAATTPAGAQYQWQKASTDIAGQTSPVLTIKNVTKADEGNYRVKISSPGCETVYSSASQVTILPNLVFTQNLDASALLQCVGTQLQLSVVATGVSPLGYQWKKDNRDISNATSANLAIPDVKKENSGIYKVVVVDGCGSPLESNSKTVTVTNGIASEPDSEIVSCLTNGVASETLSVTAIDEAATFQWKVEGLPIAGATQKSYVANQEGNYSVDVTTRQCGKVSGNNYALTFGVGIKTQPNEVNICEGEGWGMTVIGKATTGYTYQWYKAGVILSGETTSSLVRETSTQADEAVYYVEVANKCGTTQSNDANLYVGPDIITNLLDTKACLGLPVTFKIKVAGSNPTFSWLKGNSVISGQTGSAYTINSIQQSDVGNYSVRATVCNQTLTSRAALLSITSDGYFTNARIDIESLFIKNGNLPAAFKDNTKSNSELRVIKYADAVANNITEKTLKVGEGLKLKYTGETSLVSWAWNFGDGSITGTDQNPEHVYNSTGRKIISLRLSAGSSGLCITTLPITPATLIAEITGDDPFIWTGDPIRNRTTKVYPIPTKEILRVETDESANRLVIYSLLGEKLYDQTIAANKTTLDVSTYASGLYILQVHQPNGVETIKWVKE